MKKHLTSLWLLPAIFFLTALNGYSLSPKIDPIKFRIVTNASNVSLNEEFEITITAEYLNVSPTTAFVLKDANNFKLKLTLPDGFVKTGGDYYDFIGTELSPSRPKATYKLKGKFVSSSSSGIFELLRSHKNADNQSTFAAVGKLVFYPQKQPFEHSDEAARVLAGSADFVPYLTMEQLRLGVADTSRVVAITDPGKAGIFIYDPSSTALDDDAMVVRFGSMRYVRQYEFVRPEYFGAKGDGVTDDVNAINRAIAYQKGDVKFAANTYLIGTPILLQRGVRLLGTGNRETIKNRATRILLADGANCEMLQTPFAQAPANGRTHYMALEGIFFDGNGSKQTSANIGVNFQGVWITSYLKNLFIANVRGTGLAIGNGSDVNIDDLWISGCIIEDTTRYALEINKDVSSPDLFGLVYMGMVYVENIKNRNGGDPRIVQADRGNGILIRRANSVNIMDLHLEGVARMVDIESNDVINITKLSSAHCGSNSLIDGAVVRQLDETISVTVGSMRVYNTLGFLHKRASGNISNDLPDIAQGTRIGTAGFKVNGSNAVRYFLPRTDIVNQMRVRRAGSASPQEIRVDASGIGESQFWRSNGRYMELGSNYSNDGTDRVGLRIDMPNPTTTIVRSMGRLQTTKGLEFMSAIGGTGMEALNTIGIKTISGAGTGPGFARTTDSNSGVDYITTIRRASTDPSANADYLGQFWLNTSTKTYFVSVAVGSSIIANDWSKLINQASLSSVPTYPDNAAAIAGGLTVGSMYRTSSGQLMVRY